MKSFLFTLVLIGINAVAVNAQQPVLKKPNAGVIKALHSCRITGTMTYPKTITENNFINKVKANTKLFSYKIVGGQMTDKKSITITSMKVVNTTTSNSPNYTYTYEIEAVLPFDQPIDVEISSWEYSFTKLIVLEKVSPNEYATFSINDRVHAGFDFKGRFEAHPH